MFALFEVQQLCLVPLSFVWTLLIYQQTGDQVNPAQQHQAGMAFSSEDFSQWRISVSCSRKKNTLTWCIVHTVRVRGVGGGVLSLSKNCRLESNVYTAWGGWCFQWLYCFCPLLLAHATHIQGDESVAGQATMKSPRVFGVDLTQQRLFSKSQFISIFTSLRLYSTIKKGNKWLKCSWL